MSGRNQNNRTGFGAGGGGGGSLPDPVTVAHGGTGLTTITNHGVLIGQAASNVAATSAGTAGQVLTSNGASADPTFQTASGAIAAGRAVISGVTQYSLPGMPTGAVTAGSHTNSANRAEYQPFIVATQISIDQIVFELVTGVNGSTMRQGIYNADTSWQPTSLVTGTDTGDITTAIANQGVIATSINSGTPVVIPAGRYLFWQNLSTGNTVSRFVKTTILQLLGFPVAMGTNLGWQQIFVAQTYGAPPSTGLAWTTGTAAAPGSFESTVFCRVSTP